MVLQSEYVENIAVFLKEAEASVVMKYAGAQTSGGDTLVYGQ